MRKRLQKLWQDDGGTVALEYLLVATIIGLGLVVGLSNLEISLDTELTELANAISALDQGYNFVMLLGSSGSDKTGTCTIDSYGSQTVSSSTPSCATISIGVP